METAIKLFDDKGALFSECGQYRYRLWRKWDDSKPLVMCIGLNPSTANTDRNDATIHLLTRMLTKLGYGGFYMMNLFAYISSKPNDLLICENPVGDNDTHLKEVTLLCQDIIACWGTFKQATDRIKEVLPLYPNAKCFGVNKNGTPIHPLAMQERNGRNPNNPTLSHYYTSTFTTKE